MILDIPALIKTITSEIKQSMDIAVVGMSGGADSTLVAILSSLALGPQHVHSLHMPANADDIASFNRVSLMTAEALGIERRLVPIGDIAAAINSSCQQALGTTALSRVNAGNARARARMAVLYGVAHHLGESTGKRVRVMGTGNLSEDFIGYDTKGGDALADLFPIGELFKSEVYQLLDYFRDEGLVTEAMIDRVPSAGLWPGQTDEQELGHSYASMEDSVRKIRAGQLNPETAEGIDRFVWQRHQQHKHKHEAPAVVHVRQFCR